MKLCSDIINETPEAYLIDCNLIKVLEQRRVPRPLPPDETRIEDTIKFRIFLTIQDKLITIARA